MEQPTNEKSELFTELSKEEAATVNGACYYGDYESYSGYRQIDYGDYHPRRRYASRRSRYVYYVVNDDCDW
jgi:hypothetical protein